MPSGLVESFIGSLTAMLALLCTVFVIEVAQHTAVTHSMTLSRGCGKRVACKCSRTKHVAAKQHPARTPLSMQSMITAADSEWKPLAYHALNDAPL
jgi:hypothetical protein